MWEKIRRIWYIREVRNNLLFVLGMLVVYRFVSHIPVPGVNGPSLRAFLDSNQIFGLLNVFSGGNIRNLSVVMLGVAPYITASIIFQLLSMVIPRLEEISKEGESGQQRINNYTRLATVPLAFLQAFGFIKLLRQSSPGVLGTVSSARMFVILCTVVAGTTFLMWLGELITEKKVGNGISLIIFAGIISALPQAVQTAAVNYNPSDLYTYLLFVLVGLVTIVGVVYVSEAQRNIPVTYAKQAAGGRSGVGSVATHLPLRVNMAGVIPIIFAISIILFPTMIAQFFIGYHGAIGAFATAVTTFFQNQLYYAIVYFVLVFAFTYFYTAIIFQPEKIAENLQRQGGFIPGIRPGKQTEEYLARTMNRLILLGALFLSSIAILPLAVRAFTGTQSLAIGGTSLLIVVSVAIETAKQIEAQVTMHEYDHV